MQVPAARPPTGRGVLVLVRGKRDEGGVVGVKELSSFTPDLR